MGDSKRVNMDSRKNESRGSGVNRDAGANVSVKADADAGMNADANVGVKAGGIDYSVKFRAIKEQFDVLDVTLAQIMNCSEFHVRGILKGTSVPSEPELQKILRTFPVREEWLLGNTAVQDAGDAGLPDGEPLDTDFSAGQASRNVPVPMLEESYDGLSVSQRLKAFRLSMNLSVPEFAEKVDLPARKVAELEGGAVRLRPLAADRIADACRVGVDWLLYGKAERRSNPVTKEMKEWLWLHPEVRERIAAAMTGKGARNGVIGSGAVRTGSPRNGVTGRAGNEVTGNDNAEKENAGDMTAEGTVEPGGV